MNAPPAVRVSELIKAYRSGEPPAVNGLSFSLSAGTVFGLLGPNGAGKTTTVKMILGLVLPTSGSVEVMGLDLAKARHKALVHMGAILEGTRNIYWRLSARANLEYFGALRGLRGADLKRRTEEVLSLVELLDRADEETRYFSRGMQQKVALALAMLHEPDVLLLDEPTLGLDVHAARTIEQTVAQLAEQGKTIILTTHQMALAQRLCHEVLVINQGEKVAEGPTDQVVKQFDQQETVEIHLAEPVDAGVMDEIQMRFPELTAEPNGAGEIRTLSWPGEQAQSTLVALLATLDSHGLLIKNVGRRETTLEEVFVQLTGKGEPNQE